MKGWLRILLAFVLGTATAAGVAWGVFAWPILFNPEFMIGWGWIGMIISPVVGLLLWPISLKYFARILRTSDAPPQKDSSV